MIYMKISTYFLLGRVGGKGLDWGTSIAGGGGGGGGEGR